MRNNRTLLSFDKQNISVELYKDILEECSNLFKEAEFVAVEFETVKSSFVI